MIAKSGADAPRVTERLGAFAATVKWEDIPASVRHEAKRSLINFFGVALAGSCDPAVRIAVAVFGPFRAGSSATIVGRPERTDALNAATLNAMSANVFDFDDTHLPTVIHPTAPVAPALFALAESVPLSGQDLLLAFILGVDVECRLGNAISPAHYQRGWHITSTCGIFGAAVATARAMKLDAAAIGWALGNASAQSSGLVETLGTMSKSIGVGNAARNGLLSSLLAQRGFSGPRLPLEGSRAFFKVMGEKVDYDAVTRELGTRWEILANTYKPYPCGVVLNPVIEACLDLRSRPGFVLDDISQIELRGNPLLRERTDRSGVTSGRQSQVSAQHAVAVALARGRASLDEFSDEAVNDVSLRVTGAKVRFIDDPAYSIEAAETTVVMKTGARLSRQVPMARGGIGAPLSDAELERKLADLARYSGARCDIGALTGAIWSLDRAENAGSVMALAAGHT